MSYKRPIRFIYISPLEFSNVFITQVIDWLKAYKEHEIDFEIWRTSSIKRILAKAERDEISQIRNYYTGKVRKIFITSARLFPGFLYDFFLLVFLTTPQIINGKRILIQTRGLDLWKPLKYIKLLGGKRVMVVYDSRGAAGEEKLYSFQQGHVTSMRIVDYISHAEKQMVKIADSVFCVSNALIHFHIKNNPGLTKSKFYIHPCSANSEDFYYSPDLRLQIREKYHLESKKVIVYSGGLQLPWHIPSKIFELFANLYALDKSYHLLLLSPDHHLAEQKLKEHKIPDDSVNIVSVNNRMVVGYLCASDIALLLRDDVPLNNVASPTKFAEYILTGLPVIISKNVGDFSGFVEENDIGFVFNNDFSGEPMKKIHLHFNENLKKYFSKRSLIAELAKNNYSKKKNIDRILNQYQSFVTHEK